MWIEIRNSFQAIFHELYWRDFSIVDRSLHRADT
jgi:hypothetical protein